MLRTQPADTLFSVSGPIPTSFGLASLTTWRNEIGHVLSTVVGKITLELGANGAISLMRPDPIVTSDRLASDARFVVEASEMMPWAENASMLASGGPLRFTLQGEQGSSVLTASAQTPAGYSVASGERSRFAREQPIVGLDGLTTIPDELDGRYFLAAPRRHHVPAIRGDEGFVLEAGGGTVSGRLPALAMAVTVEVYQALRVVALTWDTITVDPARRRISLVGRAGIEGPATVLSHAIVPMIQLRAADRGDRPLRMTSASSSGPESMDRWPFGWAGASADPSFDDTSLFGQTLGTADVDLGSLRAKLLDDTADVMGAELGRPRESSIPFDTNAGAKASARDLNRTVTMHQVPATPFDKGFAPTAVVPAADVIATLSPDEEMAIQLKKMRAQLRAEGGGSPSSTPKKPKP